MSVDMQEKDLAPLRAELDFWQEAGLTARFWLRDDDAVADTPELRRLLELTDNADAPLLLAIIPMRLEESLPRLLSNRPAVTPAVHGAWHRNHAPPTRKSEEMALERGEAEIRRALDKARACMVASFGEVAGKWYVPPWNRLAREVAGWLPAHGFSVLSAFGDKQPAPIDGLAEVNTHVDIINWRAGRIGRPLHWLVDEVVAMLAQQRRMAQLGPIGLLTHHLVHDDVAWSSLEAVMGAISRHSSARWTSPDELLAGS
jgi:predicted deacetylase